MRVSGAKTAIKLFPLNLFPTLNLIGNHLKNGLKIGPLLDLSADPGTSPLLTARRKTHQRHVIAGEEIIDPIKAPPASPRYLVAE
jgi:hypothetical protein